MSRARVDAGSDDNPFAGPATRIPLDRTVFRRALWFLARRALRLGLSPLFVALWAVFLFGIHQPLAIAAAWLVGVALWLPTTAVQARIVFFPSPPDAWLTDTDGSPASDRDSRLWWRAAIADDLLGTAMPLWLILWMLSHAEGLPPGLRAALIGAPVLMFGVLVGRRGVALAVQEAALDLLGGAHQRARVRLERLARLPGFGSRDVVAFQLARARFRDGDLDGALTALQRIRDTRGWSADALRVQMAIGRDGTAAARAVAEALRDDPRRWPVGVAITALAALHEGRDDEVLALADRIDQMPRGEARRFSSLLLAAAQAGVDPGLGARTLVEGGWTPEQARGVAAAWPPIAARIQASMDASGRVI